MTKINGMPIKDFTNEQLNDFDNRLAYMHHWLAFMFGNVIVDTEDTAIDKYVEFKLVDKFIDNIKPNITTTRVILMRYTVDEFKSELVNAIIGVDKYLYENKKS